jgi:hypothetical protein
MGTIDTDELATRMRTSKPLAESIANVLFNYRAMPMVDAIIVVDALLETITTWVRQQDSQ